MHPADAILLYAGLEMPNDPSCMNTLIGLRDRTLGRESGNDGLRRVAEFVAEYDQAYSDMSTRRCADDPARNWQAFNGWMARWADRLHKRPESMWPDRPVSLTPDAEWSLMQDEMAGVVMTPFLRARGYLDAAQDLHKDVPGIMGVPAPSYGEAPGGDAVPVPVSRREQPAGGKPPGTWLGRLWRYLTE
jgi:hypothetical protein